MPKQTQEELIHETIVLLGLAIRYLRRENGLTRKKLAHKLGLQTETLKSLENGTGYPSVSLLIRIFDALGQQFTMDWHPKETGDVDNSDN